MIAVLNPVNDFMDKRMLHPLTRIIATALLVFSCAQAVADTQMDWQPPAFELADSDGQSLHYPEDLSGPTIVLFWASWCPYCKALMPHLQSIVDEYEGEIEVLAVNFRDDEDPQNYVSERGYDFRLFLQGDPVAKRWGVRATPGLFLVDETGRVVFSNYAIKEHDYPADASERVEEMKHYQKAARKAPFWAARLRLAIDRIRMQKAPGS
jgi:thiol-disulfide isomerase/thioredoxin